MNMVFQKIKSAVENHVEMARLFLPDKRFSTLFKVFNFLSRDYLRNYTVFASLAASDVRDHIDQDIRLIEEFSDDNPLSSEEFVAMLKSLRKYSEKSIRWIEDIFDI